MAPKEPEYILRETTDENHVNMGHDMRWGSQQVGENDMKETNSGKGWETAAEEDDKKWGIGTFLWLPLWYWAKRPSTEQESLGEIYFKLRWWAHVPGSYKIHAWKEQLWRKWLFKMFLKLKCPGIWCLTYRGMALLQVSSQPPLSALPAPLFFLVAPCVAQMWPGTEELGRREEQCHKGLLPNYRNWPQSTFLATSLLLPPTNQSDQIIVSWSHLVLSSP